MNTKRHILLNYATTHEISSRSSVTPDGCYYDQNVGAWIISKTGALLVLESDEPRPTTKKADIETGEDQKGE